MLKSITDEEKKKTAPSEPQSKHMCIHRFVCLCARLHVSEKGLNVNLFKPALHREITYLSNLLYAVSFYGERLENSHASWLKSLPLGERSQHPSEELLFWKWVNHWFPAGNHQDKSMVNERAEMANSWVQQDIQLSLYSPWDRATGVQLFSGLWLSDVWSLTEGVWSHLLCRWKWKAPSSELNFLSRSLKVIVILLNIIKQDKKRH